MSDQHTTPSIDSAAASNGAHPPEFVDKEPAYRTTTEATELLRADAGDLEAKSVAMDRSGAERITAERVMMNRSGARSIQAKSAQLDNSGAVTLTADNAVIHRGTALAVNAKSARIVKSRILLFRSEMTTVEGEVKSLVHIGQACENVKPVFDGGSALRFGAALGAVLLLGGRVLRRLSGSR